MSGVSSIPNISSLSTQVTTIVSDSQNLINSMTGKTATRESVENSHGKIMTAFRQTMGEISRLREQTWQSHQSHQARPVVREIVLLESRLQDSLAVLNNSVKTYFPLARVNTGKSCLGPINTQVSTADEDWFRSIMDSFYAVRQVRGGNDGNSFIASFAARFIETLIKEKTIDTFIDYFKDEPDLILTAASMKATLQMLQNDPSQLDQVLSNPGQILFFANYFRALVTREMLQNEANYKLQFKMEIDHALSSMGFGKYEDFAVLVNHFVLRKNMEFSASMIKALCAIFFCEVTIVDEGEEHRISVYGEKSNNFTFCRRGTDFFTLYDCDDMDALMNAISDPGSPANQTSEIIVQCQIPFGHNLFIRGSGNGLNWSTGIPLTQLTEDTWAFRHSTSLKGCEYKFLINDEIWENGGNHRASDDVQDQLQPQFTLPSNMEIFTSSTVSVHIPPTPAPIPQTQISVRFDAKPHERLFIRGTGPNMSWNQGVELRRTGANLWTFESRENFQRFEYKILLNDTQWETGSNRTFERGNKGEINPRF